MKTKIEISRKYITPTFGEMELKVDYYFTVINGNIKNTYLVVCKVTGFETADVRLSPIEATLAEHQTETNSETLVESAVIDLFEEKYLSERS